MTISLFSAASGSAFRIGSAISRIGLICAASIALFAKALKAPVCLVGDIDRGGVFAQLYGTVELLEEDERRLVKGLIINKFRGDKKLLDPGLLMIEEKLDIPVLGVVNYMDLKLEDEDSLSRRLISGSAKDVSYEGNFSCRRSLEVPQSRDGLPRCKIGGR